MIFASLKARQVGVGDLVEIAGSNLFQIRKLEITGWHKNS